MDVINISNRITTLINKYFVYNEPPTVIHCRNKTECQHCVQLLADNNIGNTQIIKENLLNTIERLNHDIYFVYAHDDVEYPIKCATLQDLKDIDVLDDVMIITYDFLIDCIVKDMLSKYTVISFTKI